MQFTFADNLTMRLEPNERDEFRELSRQDRWSYVAECLCRDHGATLTDGDETPIGLTSADCVVFLDYSDDMDDMPPQDGAPIYWFPNYMIEDFLETLADTGEVIFEGAK